MQFILYPVFHRKPVEFIKDGRVTGLLPVGDDARSDILSALDLGNQTPRQSHEGCVVWVQPMYHKGQNAKNGPEKRRDVLVWRYNLEDLCPA